MYSSYSFSENSEEIENMIKYIKKYAVFAIEEMEKFGIPASIKLGQGLLESSIGNSSLSKATNNHFGIKCGINWTGESYYHDDDSSKECFRKYNTVKDSFIDHSKFLKKPRYSKLFLLKKNDYKAWAIELQKAGYATSSKYSNLLIHQIEKYYLWKFDEDRDHDIDKRIDSYLTFINKRNKKYDSFFIRKIWFFYKIYLLIKKKINDS
ncbi:glycoside hydrolase family 73 protein [Blattabacterium cuenoti]|uniref:glycoside hydrolase family 73 protein n=1 Tax=Blattabacterium cuenoti TaxID=1653831 RepID=UPI001EEBD31D|nr:glucosaminidase domain-containing protein [Blattabacterium cuenoti]